MEAYRSLQNNCAIWKQHLAAMPTDQARALCVCAVALVVAVVFASLLVAFSPPLTLAGGGLTLISVLAVNGVIAALAGTAVIYLRKKARVVVPPPPAAPIPLPLPAPAAAPPVAAPVPAPVPAAVLPVAPPAAAREEIIEYRGPCQFDRLDDGGLEMLFSYIPIVDLPNVRGVSRRWHQVLFNAEVARLPWMMDDLTKQRYWRCLYPALHRANSESTLLYWDMRIEEQAVLMTRAQPLNPAEQIRVTEVSIWDPLLSPLLYKKLTSRGTIQQVFPIFEDNTPRFFEARVYTMLTEVRMGFDQKGGRFVFDLMVDAAPEFNRLRRMLRIILNADPDFIWRERCTVLEHSGVSKDPEWSERRSLLVNIIRKLKVHLIEEHVEEYLPPILDILFSEIARYKPQVIPAGSRSSYILPRRRYALETLVQDCCDDESSMFRHLLEERVARALAPPPASAADLPQITDLD